MKFQFALLFVLCAHALARFESIEDLKATAKSTIGPWKHGLADMKKKRDSFFRPTPKDESLPADAVVVMKKRNGTGIMSKCSAGADEITVGVERILSKTGVEFVYLPMDADTLANCFESYTSTILNAPDFISCCDAAAAGGYNSFGFDGSECKGYKAWLPSTYTPCPEEGGGGGGLFVAKKKLSKFTPTAPTFDVSPSLGLSRIVVKVTKLVGTCRLTKTLKVTTFFKNETTKLDEFNDRKGYVGSFHSPELCDDNLSAAQRTVTVSILDSDGSELVSVKNVLNNGITGRRLTSNGLCVQYTATPTRNYGTAVTSCLAIYSFPPFGNGILSFTDLLGQISGLKVGASDFWAFAAITTTTSGIWFPAISAIDESLFNTVSVEYKGNAVVDATKKYLVLVDEDSLHTTVCVDAPYYDLRSMN